MTTPNKSSAGEAKAFLDLEEAQEIANEIGYRGDIEADVLQANNYGKTYAGAERLFRGYMQEYVAERNSDNCMLHRTGYGY